MNAVEIKLSPELEKEITMKILQVTEEVINLHYKFYQNDKPFLKKKDACELLNISYATLQKFLTDGLKIHQIDGISFISRQELMNYVLSK